MELRTRVPYQTDTAGDTKKRAGALLLSLFLSVLLQSAALADNTDIELPAAPAPQHMAEEEENSLRHLVAGKIANFDIVSKGLWRGAAPSHQGLESLAQGGVKTIVDLRLNGLGTAEEEARAKSLGLKYVHIPLGYKGPDFIKVAQFLAVVNNPTNQPVFVHCRYGADRTGTLIGCFRILHDHWSFSQAYREMRNHHFKPWFAGMKKLVARLDRDPKSQKAIQALSETSDQKQVAAKSSNQG